MGDVEEDRSEEITTVGVQCQPSTGIPSPMGGSVLFPTVFMVSNVSRGDLCVSCSSHKIKLVEKC